MDTSPSTPANPKIVHFLAFIHGMWGKPEHLQVVEETIRTKFAEVEADTELVTLRVRTNADSYTYDGMDWGAERAVKEILQEIEKIEEDGSKKVTKFSIFGYSLGGLISRYAIGILYQRGFFRTIKPVNFTTFATPHLGLPRVRGLVGSMMHKLGPIMLSRTGRQFYGTDNDIWSPNAKEGRPLVEVMADPDTIFFKALKSFPNVTFYGNAVHDLTVVYCTALAEPYDPFAARKSKDRRLAIKLDPKYKHVIESFNVVSAGEPIPLSDIEKEYQERRAGIPWYSPARYRSGRPALPPFLQFPFPLNIVFYLCIPLIIPAGLTYAAIRFQRESRSSRRRLAELAESPESESSLGAILRQMEMAVADMVDSGDPGVASKRQSGEWGSEMDEGTVVVEDESKKHEAGAPNTPDAAGLLTPATTPSVAAPTVDPMSTKETKSKFTSKPKPKPDDPTQPILTPAQLSMIESLNSIPQLKKFQAFFPYVVNAHSVIVVREPGMFPVQMDGMGVVNHWVDRFVL